jgi:multiple sugar transport system ATP-binding protein
MNVADNMSYSLRLRRAPKDRIRGAVKSAADTLGLGQLLERRPRGESNAPFRG